MEVECEETEVFLTVLAEKCGVKGQTRFSRVFFQVMGFDGMDGFGEKGQTVGKKVEDVV